MPRQARELTALEVRRLPAPDKPRMVAVGGVPGLHLSLTPTGGRSWLLRATIGGKRRDVGLGSYPDVTLGAARDKARDMLARDRLGVEPTPAKGQTFEEAARDYLARKLGDFQNAKHRQQWENTLTVYAFPKLGDNDVASITTKDVLGVLEPLWAKVPETASRLRGRIEKVLDAAAAAGHRPKTVANPAQWKGNLELLLAKKPKAENQPALPYDRAPEFWQALAKRKGMGADALRFAVLTWARSGEVLGATWGEIDLEGAVWRVPASRMKMRRPHVVPLSGAAVTLLQGLPRQERNPLVFPAPRGGMLTDMAMTTLLRKMDAGEVAAGRAGWRDPVTGRVATAHGFRSAARDWAGDMTDHPREVAEAALAHRVGGVEGAYRRQSALEKRRVLMQDWAEFLTG